jgi:hypothetical protein
MIDYCDDVSTGDYFSSLLATAMKPRKVECIVVARGGPGGPRALAPGARALSVGELLG